MNILKDPLLARQSEFLEAGRRGEAWVAERERQKLANTPYAACLNTSFSQRSACFDIISSTLFGQPLYIESTGVYEVSMLWTGETEFLFQR